MLASSVHFRHMPGGEGLENFHCEAGKEIIGKKAVCTSLKDFNNDALCKYICNINTSEKELCV